MNKSVKPIPDGYNTATPNLTVKGAEEALSFYEKAFGADILVRHFGPDGNTIMHAEIRIGNSIIMLNDEFPKMGCLSPITLGGTTNSIYLYVENVDASYERAINAGAKPLVPVADMFWGDRFGQVVDPFGHRWGLATHVTDVTPEEMKKAQEAWQKQATCASN